LDRARCRPEGRAPMSAVEPRLTVEQSLPMFEHGLLADAGRSAAASDGGDAGGRCGGDGAGRVAAADERRCRGGTIPSGARIVSRTPDGRRPGQQWNRKDPSLTADRGPHRVWDLFSSPSPLRGEGGRRPDEGAFRAARSKDPHPPLRGTFSRGEKGQDPETENPKDPSLTAAGGWGLSPQGQTPALRRLAQAGADAGRVFRCPGVLGARA
jgi:hypothetical protein